MEVTISGTETLQNYGLHTIKDLSRVSFQKLTRDSLRFKLPMIEPSQHLFEDARVQMRNRGVYGVNLRLRALAEESRLAVKKAGEGTPCKTKDEELVLADWKEINDIIGVALDRLQKRWSCFTTSSSSTMHTASSWRGNPCGKPSPKCITKRLKPDIQNPLPHGSASQTGE
jgi:hypothetical protein